MDKEQQKNLLVKVLKGAHTIFSVAGAFNPIFGVFGSLFGVVVNHIDDGDIQKIKEEFDEVNKELEKLSEQNRNTLQEIRKNAIDQQFSQVENNIQNQYRKYMEMVKKPETKDDFKNSYSKDQDENLHTLYDLVMGPTKLFSEPILKVYLKYSKGDCDTMKRLCTHIIYVFSIGLIAHIGFAGVFDKTGEYEKEQIEKWTKNMKEVNEKMKEALSSCV